MFSVQGAILKMLPDGVCLRRVELLHISLSWERWRRYVILVLLICVIVLLTVTKCYGYMILVVVGYLQKLLFTLSETSYFDLQSWNVYSLNGSIDVTSTNTPMSNLCPPSNMASLTNFCTMEGRAKSISVADKRKH